MTNFYNNYYLDQAGTGIDSHSGYRHNMRGNGFFGRFITNSVWPLVQKLTPIAVKGARGLIDMIDPQPEPKVKRKRKRKKIHSKKTKKYF